MGLSELRKEIIIKKAKKRKKIEELINDFARVIQKFDEAVKELKNFERKWGKSEELKIASAEGFLDEYSKILRRLRRPTFLEKILGRHKRILANEILTIAREKSISIISIGELYSAVREEIGDIDLKEFKEALIFLKNEGQIYSIVEREGVEYVVFPWFISEAKKIIEYVRTKPERSITLDEVVVKINIPPSIAEILLDELVKLGIMVREEFPRRYVLISS